MLNLATAEACESAAASAFGAVRRLWPRDERAMLLQIRRRSWRNAVAQRLKILAGSKL